MSKKISRGRSEPGINGNAPQVSLYNMMIKI